MKIHLFYGVSLNNIISKKGRLPWHIPELIDKFKRLAKGSTVLLNESSAEFLLPVFVSPNSKHAIVKKPTDFLDILNHLKEKNVTDVLVIGNKELLQIASNYADDIYLTKVFKIVTGDSLEFGPEYNFHEWESEYTSSVKESAGLRYQYVHYLRK